MLTLGNFNLTLGNNPTPFVGYNDTSFVFTSGTGVVTIPGFSPGGRTDTVVFPVGSQSTVFAPVVMANAGQSQTDFSVRALDGIRQDGLTGTVLTSDAIGVTWDITSTLDSVPAVSAYIELHFGAGSQLSSFNQASSFVSHYIADSATWSTRTAAASDFGNGVSYLVTGGNYAWVNNITSFSPFGVGDPQSVPLPVTFTKNGATAQGNDACVEWTVAQELNASHYLIERSTNETSFQTAGKVTALGTTAVEQRYAFSDVNASEMGKMVWYRIRSIDVDGSMGLTRAVAVNFTNAAAALSLVAAPSPFRQSLNLLASGLSAGDYTLTINDLQGRTVVSRRIALSEGTATIAISEAASLTAGSYSLTLTGTNNTATIRVVKAE